MVFQKAIDDIVKADIEALVDAGMPERQTLDYKQALPEGWTDRDKGELLADLCSFANTQGGWILYGVREKRAKDGPTGIPEVATGIAGLNADHVRLRIEQAAAAGIEPRIPGLRIEAVAGFPDGPVLLIRVPRSWLRPHMLTDRSPFYARNGAGKYRLDVQQIRASFMGGEATAERIRRFRQDRIGMIFTGEGPGPLFPGCKLVMHVVPLASFEAYPSPVAIPLEQARLLPPGGGAHQYRYNLDGVLGYEHFLMLSILEAAGWSLAELWGARSTPFDRGLIDLPDVLVEDLDADAGQALRSVFDTLWQASGAEGSPSYGEDGRRL